VLETVVQSFVLETFLHGLALGDPLTSREVASAVYNDLLPNFLSVASPQSFERLLTTLFALHSTWVIRLKLQTWQPTAAFAERQRKRLVSQLKESDAVLGLWS
jgi:hypothetical protein